MSNSLLLPARARASRCCRIAARRHAIVGLLALSFAACTIARAAPDATPPTFAVNVYDVYAGLPHHGAPVLLQTRDGYLWVGTEAGLARFDGVRFVTYRAANTPALPANLIRCLFEDRDGWLWIGTQGGLCRYREQHFERVGLESNRIASITQDRAGRVWIATQDAGLFEYRAGQIISHRTAPGMPAENDLRFVFADSRDRLWVLFRSAGVIFLEDGAWHRFDPGTFAASDYTRMTEAPAGTLWIATERNGLLRVRDGELKVLGAPQGLPKDIVRSLLADRLGRLWVVTNTLQLLADPDAESFVRVPLPAVENCREIIEDREGSFWVGSAGDGVVRMRPSGFRMLTAEDGLLGGNTRSVALAADGTVWAGHGTSGAVTLAPDGRTTLIKTASGSAGEVWSIAIARDGAVWLGGRGVLRVWRDGQEQVFPQFERVRALFEDRTGAMWIGSETEGVTRYRGGAFESLAAEIAAPRPTTPRHVAMVFAESPDGTVYIGLRENGGLVRVKDGKFTSWRDLPSNDIRAIYPDADGNLWVGTKGRGLLLRRHDTWLNPEAFSEPFNDQVSSILEDAQGRIWLGTPKGIVWAPKAQLLAVARGEGNAGAFRLALAGDGVRPGTVGAGSSPNSARSADGRLWFATRHGLAVVNPEKITRNDVVPPVQIERVWHDNHPAPPSATVRLPAGTHSLAIDYTALSFVGPSQVLFRYRLEGRDRKWIDAGNRRTALYADLPPGEYRFHVIACNEDGLWNETGANIGIEQLPFFYQTRWCYTLIGLTLAGASLGVYRWRTAALTRRNQQLERAIAERTAELAKSYEAIRASEYFYHSLVESLPQIIVRKDTGGRFTYANAGFSHLVGRPLAEIIGRTDADFFPAPEAEKARADDQRVMATRQPLEFESVVEEAGRKRFLHVKKVPLFGEDGHSLGVQLLYWDMTNFREIEEKLRQAQRELVETSRLAGIAEMATGILHNLGNALNSVNTSASLAAARVRESRVLSLQKVSRLLAQQNGDLPEFLRHDPRGRQLPGYLAQLGEHLGTERHEILRELTALQENVDHIKELVAAQQQYARVAAITEVLSASELVEFALRIMEASLRRHGIAVVRERMSAPPVKVERQKAVQILTNLVSNAKDALKETGRSDKQLIVGVRVSAEGRPQIYLTDNGVGIAAENLTRVFAFGFTTKKHGHGFGLHSSALAARELGGSLTASSPGLGKGATFTLELPALVELPPAPGELARG